ncbi:DUF3100 domain-containing protein [Arthrobacter cryoconiti]|uniref:DUF3100 domain-containing protein n=1 Tax=Arthrobacter cryoconiti TaxID=748907 RepID=A0ABV8QXS1_9MICC|nr:DUF3100 domain-containing protein [Arthrobacter cryoconiti]MCC9067659.1 DUF3100 domain-containing protein [Arthrobacter cryoconiti]
MSTRPAPAKAGLKHTLPIALLALVIALAVQFIGSAKINVGIGSIVIFPMVWGLIVGLLISVQKFKPLGLDLQKVAAALVGVAVMLLVARLAFNIGPSLPVLVKAGPALLLQEVGHLLGTVFLALPLAVLLRMGTATVGATFSLDREPSFAMVSEKYGPDSDQYRGVLAMYVFGTLFGAVFITLLTSLVANWGIFNPLALAMGSGVGSGSMMAASVASITTAYPGNETAILGIAAVSNLITTILGVYVGIYVSLPLADKFYKLLTRKRTAAALQAQTVTASAAVVAGGTTSSSVTFAPETAGASGAADVSGATTTSVSPDASGSAGAVDDANRDFRDKVAQSTAEVKLPLWLSLSVLSILGIGTASVAAKGLHWNVIGGYVVLMALVVLGLFLHKISRKVSAIIWITTIGAYASSPWFFAAGPLTKLVSSVDFLSIATVMLTLAGLSLGKDVPLLKNIGWKIIPVGLVAITASFMLSVVIAEFSLGYWS